MTREIYEIANTNILAFLGDAVYETFVRKHVISSATPGTSQDTINKRAIGYVRADAQAKVSRRLLSDNFLKPEEEKLLKRARNKKSSSRSRSAGPLEYRLATAFEALVGGLEEARDSERLKEIIDFAFFVLEEEKR